MLSSRSYRDFVNAAYKHLLESDDGLESWVEMYEFLIRLRHSYVDNDKPISSFEDKYEMCEKVWRVFP